MIWTRYRTVGAASAATDAGPRPFGYYQTMTRQSEAVVLLHGLWMHGVVMTALQRRLRRDTGFTTQHFSYHTVSQDLETNRRKLLDWMHELSEPVVHLVGHSLGGVLAVMAVADADWDRPGRVVCLGSPLVDSKAARHLRRWPGGNTLLGRTLRDAVLEHPLHEAPSGHEVGVIAGNVAVGIGRLLGPLEKPNDGVVSVAETRLPGVTDHVVLPVTHLGLVFSPRVAEQTASFLRYGRFVVDHD